LVQALLLQEVVVVVDVITPASQEDQAEALVIM
jgi:hypothetical protein